MRGTDLKQDALFSYVSPEARVPGDHPLRALRERVDGIPQERPPHFAQLYAKTGRPSIPPERLLRALLLQIFYTVGGNPHVVKLDVWNLKSAWGRLEIASHVRKR